MFPNQGETSDITLTTIKSCKAESEKICTCSTCSITTPSTIKKPRPVPDWLKKLKGMLHYLCTPGPKQKPPNFESVCRILKTIEELKIDMRRVSSFIRHVRNDLPNDRCYVDMEPILQRMMVKISMLEHSALKNCAFVTKRDVRTRRNRSKTAEQSLIQRLWAELKTLKAKQKEYESLVETVNKLNRSMAVAQNESKKELVTRQNKSRSEDITGVNFVYTKTTKMYNDYPQTNNCEVCDVQINKGGVTSQNAGLVRCPEIRDQTIKMSNIWYQSARQLVDMMAAKAKPSA